MRSLLFSFVLATILWSCTKRDDTFLSVPCTDSCTTVRGRFQTGNSEPIPGLPLEVRFESSPTFGLGQTTIRKIATGKTDNNGFYSFTFSLKPLEYSEHNRHVFLTVNYDKTSFLPIPWYDQYGTDEIISVRSGKRDTTIVMDYYFASKAQLRLQLNNFTPSSTTDSFYIRSVYHEVGYDKRHVTEQQFLLATQSSNEKVIPIAGNQQNKISVVRRKGGTRTVSDTMIYTPTNQTTLLTLNF